MDFVTLMKEGRLFHSVDAVTVNVRSPDLLGVLGMGKQNGSREEQRLGEMGYKK